MLSKKKRRILEDFASSEFCQVVIIRAGLRTLIYSGWTDSLLQVETVQARKRRQERKEDTRERERERGKGSVPRRNRNRFQKHLFCRSVALQKTFLLVGFLPGKCLSFFLYFSFLFCIALFFCHWFPTGSFCCRSVVLSHSSFLIFLNLNGNSSSRFPTPFLFGILLFPFHRI